MRIAIIGGAGFVGAHLVSALLQRGDQILIYDRHSGRIAQSDLIRCEQIRLVEAHICDGSRLLDELTRFSPDVICHFAALHYIPYCDRYPAETLRVNVEGTLNVMLAASQISGLRGVLFASSVAVYAPTDATHGEREQPVPCDIYGLSKWLAEQVVEQYACRLRISHLSLRFTNIYGPEETNPHVIPAVLQQLLAGADTLRLGRTDPCRDFLYIDDLVNALIAAISLLDGNEIHEVVNLGAGREWPVQAAVDILCRLSEREICILRDEDRMRALDRMHLRADITKARHLLAWEPRHDLRAGLEKTFCHERTKYMQHWAATEVSS